MLLRPRIGVATPPSGEDIESHHPQRVSRGRRTSCQILLHYGFFSLLLLAAAWHYYWQRATGLGGISLLVCRFQGAVVLLFARACHPPVGEEGVALKPVMWGFASKSEGDGGD